MRKVLNILWEDGDDYSKRSLIEQLVTDMEDFAYAYDLEEDMRERLKDFFDAVGIEYNELDSDEEDF